MDFWEYLARNTGSPETHYKKWLDVSSGHFCFKESNDIELRTVRKIIRKCKEVFDETGRYLVFVSSGHNYKKSSVEDVPVFLTPVSLQWMAKERRLVWQSVQNNYFLNQELSLEQLELHEHEINQWIAKHDAVDISNITLDSPALFFDLNFKSFLQKDTAVIASRQALSQALRDLFNDILNVPKTQPNPNFLAFIHSLPMDDSQAKAIQLGMSESCHIKGPPGTGKSQTIVNLVVQEMLLGRRIAVLSQKKVAIEIIQKRLEQLELKDWILNLQDESRLTTFHKSLEDMLDVFLSHRTFSVLEKTNITYYKHCVRTLEDYYNAKKSSLKGRSAERFHAHMVAHDLLKVFYPCEKILSLDPRGLIDKVLKIQNSLGVIKGMSQLKLEVIASLQYPLHLLSKLDFKIAKVVLTQSRVLNTFKRLQKKKRQLLLGKPKECRLAVLSAEKLEYYQDYLMSHSFIDKLLDTKSKEIKKEVCSLIADWKSFNSWTQIEEVKAALKYKKWEMEWNEFLHKENIFNQTVLVGISPESYQYIQSKMESNIPAWIFVRDYWFKLEKFDYAFWNDLINDVQMLMDKNSNVANLTIDQFLNFDFHAAWPYDNIVWDELCSLNFRSEHEWSHYMSNSTNLNLEYPVLKNYSAREIIHMAQFVRQNYRAYRNYQIQTELSQYISKKSQFLRNFLGSRKEESKEQRKRWKSSIEFIHKHWSQKRKLPTLLQSIVRLDFEFLLWLKPITIGSLDKFSQFVPLEMELFDLIVIDEASQVELLDSIPALYRAKRVIVVGDGHQLTPSRFFKHQLSTLDNPHESLLELAQEKLPMAQLGYQYRAKYKELIDYSNRYFYDGQLLTTSTKSQEAIQYEFVPNAVYSNRMNPQEVKTIVEQLMRISQSKDREKSIGVITFSIQQKEAILSELDKQMGTIAELENALKFWNNMEEPFFVKSIEQVQGDERDIILISTGYGRNHEGKLYHFFGPILSYKGENRLNVLMSRAREKIIFITSIKSSELHIRANSSLGLIRFKQLLEYAEHPFYISSITSRLADSYWQYFLNPFKN